MNAIVAEVMPDQPRAMVRGSAHPGDLLRIAVEKGASIEQLQQLMDLQERYEANEARKAFVAAMAAFKTEPLEVLKRKLVEFKTRDGDVTSYRHAELADVTAVVCPALAKHGLSHAWAIDQTGAQIGVTCTLTHELGHRESVAMHAAPDGSGKKNAIQQVASTVTYLQRYTLLAICGIATAGMDDDGRAGGDAEPEPEISAEEQAAAAARAEEAEQRIANLSAAIQAAATLDELKKAKADMTKAYAGMLPPAELVQAYNARFKFLKQP